MEDRRPTSAVVADGMARFELAPPRRFVLPAILLLLSERPGYGYGLVPRLQEFHMGHIDRPAVYRALAQLERDGLVEASAQHRSAGQARRVYRITRLGEQVLRVWMGVIREEHDCLGEVLRRYHATATTDAVLAEVEGTWAAALSFGWPPAASNLVGPRALPFEQEPVAVALGPPPPAARERDGRTARPTSSLQRFRLVPDRSVVLIEVRSTVGPLSFGTIGVSGWVEAAVTDGVVHTERVPSGQIVIDMSGLRSGNSLYDAELLRRIEARRFPTATVDLRECAPSELAGRYNLLGDITFHGVGRPARGAVQVETTTRGLVVTGEQVVDIRDFAIPSPTVLMLRIYPDVRVRLQVEAEPEDAR